MNSCRIHTLCHFGLHITSCPRFLRLVNLKSMLYTILDTMAVEKVLLFSALCIIQHYNSIVIFSLDTYGPPWTTYPEFQLLHICLNSFGNGHVNFRLFFLQHHLTISEEFLKGSLQTSFHLKDTLKDTSVISSHF